MLSDLFLALSHFSLIEQGGPVLWGLLVLLLVLSLVSIERVLFLWVSFPHHVQQWQQAWLQRDEQQSWYAQAQRNACLAEAENSLFPPLGLLKLLVKLCPMVGLLGTVVGMIHVFELLAWQSEVDPQLLAAGIAMATLPTMAGLVSALFGMLAYARLLKLSQAKLRRLQQQLRSR